MVLVSAGEFWMGCDEKVDSECQSDEKPGRRVYLDSFSIDKTEVTVAEYRRRVQAGRCKSEGLRMPYYRMQFYRKKEQPKWAWACNWGKGGRESHPINCVDWNQAKAYCEWAGKRLPTEAEWEKAARGTDGRRYPWGNLRFGDAGKVANIADETAKREQSGWTVEEGYDDGYYGTAPVGSYPEGASPYGALDMIGNVWEWVEDWYSKGYYHEGPSRNPRGPGSGKRKIIRGGSWNNRPKYARTLDRARNGPGNRAEYVGFRCAQ